MIPATTERASRTVRSIDASGIAQHLYLVVTTGSACSDEIGTPERRVAPALGPLGRPAGRGTNESGCDARQWTNSLSFASTVSITSLSTYSVDSPRKYA